MRDGFLKIAAGVPKIKLCDPAHNANAILCLIDRARTLGVKLLVLPELTLTGRSCGGMFGQESLLSGAECALRELVAATRENDMLVVLGLPARIGGAVYNCAVALQNGRPLALVPKTYAGGVEDDSIFAAGRGVDREIEFIGHKIPFAANLLLLCRNMGGLAVGIEVGSDYLAPTPPSAALAQRGATIILNPSAEAGLAGRSVRRRSGISELSARLICAYVRANAGEGESTTDFAYTGQCVIAEAGELITGDAPDSGLAVTEIDVGRLLHGRSRSGFFAAGAEVSTVEFSLDLCETTLTRNARRIPFSPETEEARGARCEEIFALQVAGLRQRMEHIGAKNLVLGLSGGLDSALAAIVCSRTTDAMGLPRDATLSITMPCFGTTGRTRSSAELLATALSHEFREINISEAVSLHFRDIGHSPENRNAAFENAQARERTQVLMDVANDVGGIVVGTGDLSELALGWATYGGDLMSMYGVNGGIPKTLVRYLVTHERDGAADNLRAVLGDIIDTPVSPELLPPKDGEIQQKTEELVGPYELHDFFIYHMLRRGATPRKLRRLAAYVFSGEYDLAEIEKWLRAFLSRLVSQQFKRNPMPDGVTVGTVGLSPRGGFSLPSDASADLLLGDLDTGIND